LGGTLAPVAVERDAATSRVASSAGRQRVVGVCFKLREYGDGGLVLSSNLRDALPNAPFIGFTGKPIKQTDANTRAVFGDYISIYDIQRAVADKATVPIYYEIHP